MNESLQEIVSSAGTPLRVDRAAGVIRGVKVLGLESKNGRSYLAEALAQAVPLYEGAKVNVNHPKQGPGATRDYQDRIGVLKGVALRADAGLFADLHYNPKHALAEQLAWDAEHAPENVGLSHNVEARLARRGDRTVVESILRVQSVDLVADPATTRGLFEGGENEGGERKFERRGREEALVDVTVATLREARPELVAAIQEEARGEIEQLRAEVERLTDRETAREKRALARRLLAEFRLPDPDDDHAETQAIVGEEFLRTLLAADEPSMRRLVAERARLVEGIVRSGLAGRRRSGQPCSREQRLVESGPAALDARQFVRAIT